MAARGNCYICGKELSKAGVKKHLAVHQHNGPEAGEECVLLKIEGAYYKDYWLFLDIPLTATLDGLDRFLREIWLECCGHMSAAKDGRPASRAEYPAVDPMLKVRGARSLCQYG